MRSTTRCHPLQRRIGQCLLLVFMVTLFAACSDGDNKRARHPVPILTSVSPTSAMVGTAALTMTATGSGFDAASVLNWNGTALPTTYISATQLTAQLPASGLQSATVAHVTVVNPTPGGGTSAAADFTVQNPVPTLASIGPSSVVAGSTGFDLTVTGTNFINGAAVQWNGTPRTTTFVSATSLRAAIPAADLATAGTAQVRVVTPGPGGGTTTAATFTILALAPVPTVTVLNPTGVVAGSPGMTLFVTGTGFGQGTTILWNGLDRQTTVLSATQASIAVPAADLVNDASVPISVRNPAPGGGLSNALYFVITRPPVVTQEVTMITIAPDGSPPNGPSINGGMDWWGRHAIFASKASNLVPNDTNDAWDVFARDLCVDGWGAPQPGCTPTTTRLSVAPDGAQANGDSGDTASSDETSVAVSFNARFVAFVSAASNLVPGDTNGVDDVFVRDTCIGASTPCTPQTVRVSLRNDGTQVSAGASKPALGVDGSYVIFESADTALVAGDTNGVVDVFMRRTCLGQGPECTPATQRVSVGLGGAEANAASHAPAFTGRYVAFTSGATNLVAGDTNGVVDVFLFDTCIGAAACTPATERISLAADGAQANGPSAEPVVALPMGSSSGYDYHGRFVVFSSTASNLVSGDTNGVGDIFMRDTCRGRPGCIPSTQRVSLTAEGSQITGQPSIQPGHLRWDGEVVLWVTAADGVVANDTNGVADVFARGVCHDPPTGCVTTTTRVSHGPTGAEGNGASTMPRGNHDAWTGPDFVMFFSTATNFVTGTVPTPYYGAIFLASAY